MASWKADTFFVKCLKSEIQNLSTGHDLLSFNHLFGTLTWNLFSNKHEVVMLPTDVKNCFRCLKYTLVKRVIELPTLPMWILFVSCSP